jgi:hypothetical protein
MALQTWWILRQKLNPSSASPANKTAAEIRYHSSSGNHIRREKVHFLQRVKLAVRIPSSAVPLAQLLDGAALQRCDENQND